MPETYKECLRVINDATQADSWITIGKLSSEASRHNRPTAEYKSYESKVTIDGKEYRAIVIHSDVLDKRRQKKIARRLKLDKTEIEKACKDLERLEFQSEQNTETFIEILPEGRYHKLEWGIEKQEIYKRGRPKKDKKREVASIYYKLKVKVIPDGKLIEKLREEAGCFVLLTNIPQREYTGKSILQTYKEQYGIEQNFGFLKDPLIVNDLFLKKPERIEALGLVLIIALLVWRLIERNMRKFIRERDITIAGWDNKPTRNPTTFMMTTKFCSVHILKLDKKRFLARNLKPVQKEYLEVMGLREEIFVNDSVDLCT